MVLEARARGLSVKEVASELNLSYRSVRHHLESIHSRLGVRSTQEALCKLAGDKCGKCLFGYLPHFKKP